MDDPLTIQRGAVESFTASSFRVDAEAGIVREVKILGFESVNRRFYKPEAVRAAVHLYEGIAVNIDHGKKPGEVRSYASRFGVLRNVRFVENKGLFGDLHYNTKHPSASQFSFDAIEAPDNLGLSHDATLAVARKNDSQGRKVIEQIIKVKSVDVVTDPATTKNLFESVEPMPNKAMESEIGRLKTSGMTMAQIAKAMNMDEATMGDMMSGKKQMSEEMLSKLKAIKGAKKPAPKVGQESSGGDLIDANESTVNSRLDRIENVLGKLADFVESTVAKSVSESIDAELKSAGLDPNNAKHVPEFLANQLAACESADERKVIIDDRVALLKPQRQTARPKAPTSHRVPYQESAHGEPLGETDAYAKSLLS